LFPVKLRYRCTTTQILLAASLLAELVLFGCAPAPAFQPIPTPAGTSTLTAAAPPTASAVVATPTAPIVKATTSTPTQLPSPSASPVNPEICSVQSGQIEHQSLSTGLLPQPLEFGVYLPPCYTSQLEHHYPVLYLMHGQTFTDDQWVRLGITTLADRLISAGEIPPLLIVMPRENNWPQPDDTNFGKTVTDALLPWIDSHYRTIPERSSRAIGGVSRGAAWAVHLGLSRWQLFGAIGAHSLPIFWTDSEQITRWLDAIPVGAVPRIYLDIGKNDADLASAIEFENLINARGIPHEWYIRPGYHGEVYWQAHIEEYLRWYAAQW
jgi:enterochelin esterase-like enzyme